MRRKTFFPVLMVYAAIALLLPVLPASKAPGTHARTSILMALRAAAEPGTVFANSRDDSDRDWPVSDQENIQKTFAMPSSGARSLEIDNVWGSIEVVADTTDKVEMTVARKTRAESKDELENVSCIIFFGN